MIAPRWLVLLLTLTMAGCAGDPFRISAQGELPLFVEVIYECWYPDLAVDETEDTAEFEYHTCLALTGPPYLGPRWMCMELTSDTTGTRPRDCRDDVQ